MKIEITKEWLKEFLIKYIDQESYYAFEGDEGGPNYENQILQLLLQSKENIELFNEYINEYLENDDENTEQDKDNLVEKIIKEFSLFI